MDNCPKKNQKWRLKKQPEKVATIEAVKAGGIFGKRVAIFRPWTKHPHTVLEFDTFLKYYEPQPPQENK